MYNSICRDIERNCLLFYIAVSVFVYRNVMVIAWDNKIGRNFISVGVEDRSTHVVALVADWDSRDTGFDGDFLYGNAFFFIQPNWIFIYVGECFLRVFSKFVEPVG